MFSLLILLILLPCSSSSCISMILLSENNLSSCHYYCWPNTSIKLYLNMHRHAILILIYLKERELFLLKLFKLPCFTLSFLFQFYLTQGAWKCFPQVAVNCAGIWVEGGIMEMPVDAYDRQVGVNLKGSFLLAQGAVQNLGRLELPGHDSQVGLVPGVDARVHFRLGSSLLLDPIPENGIGRYEVQLSPYHAT